MFKPMLAGEADLEKLKFPLLASAKLDGIRAVVIDGKLMSRSLKPIPNEYVQGLFGDLDAADGELIVGEPTDKACFRNTTTGVMTIAGTPDVSFYLFDHIRFPTKRYTDRHNLLQYDAIRYPHVKVLPQHVVTCMESLLKLEEDYLNLGYEGLILRDPHAQYKFGRSTTREGILLKLKRFVDAEAEVIGFEERMHNGNEATVNELGRTKRSSHAANKTGRGDLGAILVRFGEVEFSIGTGFTDDERNTVWNARDQYLGRLAKFKYFPVGVKTAPRHPVFLGWRDKIDV